VLSGPKGAAAGLGMTRSTSQGALGIFWTPSCLLDGGCADRSYFFPRLSEASGVVTQD
jgi:hypothetical protein